MYRVRKTKILYRECLQENQKFLFPYYFKNFPSPSGFHLYHIQALVKTLKRDRLMVPGGCFKKKFAGKIINTDGIFYVSCEAGKGKGVIYRVGVEGDG